MALSEKEGFYEMLAEENVIFFLLALISDNANKHCALWVVEMDDICSKLRLFNH